jgi:hypothetical protein
MKKNPWELLIFMFLLVGVPLSFVVFVIWVVAGFM